DVQFAGIRATHDLARQSSSRMRCRDTRTRRHQNQSDGSLHLHSGGQSMRTPALAYALGISLLVSSLLVMETAHGRGRPATRQSASANAVLDTPNKNGVLRSISLDGSDVIKP